MLIIGGATATGKSGLAIEVAKKINGEIVSADSMQIYKYMNIGTAKVTEKEKSGIKHHLIDIVEPELSFSVAKYSEMAKRAIEDIKIKNKVPIIVGGTGLYINSLIYEYKLSVQDLGLREKLKKELEMHGKEYMYDKLTALDALSASTIHCNNTKRVLRALEVFMLTGASIVAKTDKMQAVPHIMYAVNIDRQIMYNNIDIRVEQMFENGLVDEIAYLVNEKKLSFDVQSMQGIGYKEFREYMLSYNINEKEINNDKQGIYNSYEHVKSEIKQNGNKSLEEVKNDIKQHTRNYAKRQITWFKSIPSCNWLNMQENCDIVELISNQYYEYNAKLEL